MIRVVLTGNFRQVAGGDSGFEVEAVLKHNVAGLRHSKVMGCGGAIAEHVLARCDAVPLRVPFGKPDVELVCRCDALPSPAAEARVPRIDVRMCRD